MNDQFKVVGIDFGPDELEGRGNRKAVHIRFILKGFMTYEVFKRKIRWGRTENELWLEKINQIPQNEYEYVGSGGYGQVYKIKIQTELAFKIFRPVGKLCDYKDEARAYEKEYKLVTSLENHPRIIQFFGFVTDVKNTRLIIIMEYMEGGSLTDKLKSENPLPDESVLKYLTQILEGVSFLHRREIYHSDIKPASDILFTAEDKLKISDFGIAVTKSSTTSSHFQGDFHYMSPERLNGADRSAANDMWRVGGTFVHMISGQPVNHLDTNIPQLSMNISKYKIVVEGNPLKI